MSIEELKEKQSSMSDVELIRLAESELSKLCKTGGKSLHLSVPPKPTDTDMLFCELIKRLKDKSNIE